MSEYRWISSSRGVVMTRSRSLMREYPTDWEGLRRSYCEARARLGDAIAGHRVVAEHFRNPGAI